MRRQVVGWAQHRAKHRARSRTEKTLRSEAEAGAAMDLPHQRAAQTWRAGWACGNCSLLQTGHRFREWGPMPGRPEAS